MTQHLTILKKGLLIVATPLLIEAILISSLIRTQFAAIEAQQWAVHTKEVMNLTEEIYRELIEAYAGMRILVVSNSPAMAEPLRKGIDRSSRHLDDLHAMVSDNKPQQELAARLAVEAGAFRDWFHAVERQIEMGDRQRAIGELDQGAILLVRIRSLTDTFLAEEAILDDKRLNILKQAMARQTWTLIAGGATLLAASLVLSLVFLNGVIKRLRVVRDNALSYAAGRGLLPRLGGDDEIAEVDQAFHAMAASLDEQKQENEMFVYSVSHDLRSPLVNLEGFSEELKLSCGDLLKLFNRDEMPPALRRDGITIMSENIDESIRYIQVAVGRLARIIDALLRLSRAGRVEYQPRMVDVTAKIHKVVDALHDTTTRKKAEIEVHPVPETWGDPTAIEQIFANLIGNAVNYLDERRPGKIEIGHVDPSSVMMKGFNVYFVKDNGLGIPEAYHQRVFNAFSRLQTNVAQGEGIGLALVRRMIERHGGRIWLDSAAGLGTTFYVALPAALLNAADSARQEWSPGGPVLNGEKKSTWQPSRF